MAEQEECCVCFERFNTLENFPLKSASCKHVVCTTCVTKISIPQPSDAHVKCPLCREDEVMEMWKPDIETLERAMAVSHLEEIRSCAYPNRKCYMCLQQKPFNDHHICVTCYPEVIRHIVEPDLSFSTSKTLCSDCDVYHCLYHEGKNNYPPLTVPMSTLVSPDSHHILYMATAYLDTYDLHSDSPIICVALLRRLLQRDLQKPLDKNIVYFLLTHISNSDYFTTIPENRYSEVRDIPETYVNFYREYLGCLQLIIRNYRNHVDFDIIGRLITVTSQIATTITTWPISIIRELWTHYGETIFRYTYHSIVDLDKQAFTTERVNMVPRLVTDLAKFDCCPASALFSEIVPSEVTNAKSFDTKNVKETENVNVYCQCLENMHRKFQVKYFDHISRAAFNKGGYQLNSTNTAALT